MKLVFAFSAALLLGAGGAQAITVDPSSTADFDALCGGCEIIVPTIRGGNQSATGDWEVAVNDDGTDNKNLAWKTGQAYGWNLSYTGGTLAVEAGGVLSQTVIDLSAANVIYVRTRAEDNGTTEVFGDFSILNDGTTSDQTAWLRVTDFFDTNGEFAFSGDLAFGFLNTNANGSRYIVQFKIGEEPAPIPVPAAAWMLLVGLSGLVVVGRRRRTA